jgi:hypothetical protein
VLLWGTFTLKHHTALRCWTGQRFRVHLRVELAPSAAGRRLQHSPFTLHVGTIRVGLLG